MPIVSVVLPAFNAAATIQRAIDSLLRQTLEDIEVIVVDDGSTDQTASLVQRIRDPRVQYIHRTHGGVATAANAGLQRASGEFIARMDADDFSHPERLSHQLDYLQTQDLNVVGCRVNLLDGDGSPVASLARYARWINEETSDHERIMALRFVEFPLVNPTILARRAYFELGFRDNDFPEDYDLMLRAAEAGMRFGKAPLRGLDWIDHASRQTRTHSRYSTDAFMRCRRFHLRRGPLRDCPEVDLWGVGKTGKPWLRWLQAEGVAVRRCYDIAAQKTNQQIHGVRVHHPDSLSTADGVPVIVAVGAKGARATILPQLQARGYQLGKDIWFVA